MRSLKRGAILAAALTSVPTTSNGLRDVGDLRKVQSKTQELPLGVHDRRYYTSLYHEGLPILFEFSLLVRIQVRLILEFFRAKRTPPYRMSNGEHIRNTTRVPGLWERDEYVWLIMGREVQEEGPRGSGGHCLYQVRVERSS